MKKLLSIILLSFILSSCGKEVQKWQLEGTLRTIRIDDDSEYHFSTDNIVDNDVRTWQIWIRRDSTVKEPQLYRLYSKCEDGKVCASAGDNWVCLYRYGIVLPIDYKIETFDD